MSITVPDIDIRVVDKIVKAALDEDIGYCDLTTEAVVSEIPEKKEAPAMPAGGGMGGMGGMY